MLAALLFAAATCPIAAPEFLAVQGACSPYQACPNGAVTWQIAPVPAGPNAGYGGYQIEPCDTVLWSFGDGTTQTVVGTDRVTHDYPLPGNYTVRATVSNALGSTDAAPLPSVIATSPSRLRFVTGNSSDPGCFACVVAREGGGAVTIDVERSLDLSRTITADAVVTFDHATVRAPLQFAPNETRKSFTVDIPNDNVYSGTRYFPLTFENVHGGALTLEYTLAQPVLAVVDDDPVPTLSIDPLFSIAEGDAEWMPIAIPLHLSAPMGVDVYLNANVTLIADTLGDNSGFTGVIRAGETSGALTGSVRGNLFPEPDKSFLVTISTVGGNVPLLGVKSSLVTIVNDDAALYPPQTSAPVGTPILLVLNIGSPFHEPASIALTSSAPDVVPVPAPVTIAAGETKVSILVTGIAGGTAQIGAVVPGRKTQPSTIEVTPARRRAAGR
jgi:PKD repeat protein